MSPMDETEFERKVNSLPPKELAELESFVDALLAKQKALLEAERKSELGSTSDKGLTPNTPPPVPKDPMTH